MVLQKKSLVLTLVKQKKKKKKSLVLTLKKKKKKKKKIAWVCTIMVIIAIYSLISKKSISPKPIIKMSNL